MAAYAGRRGADIGKLSTILLFLPPALLLFTLFVVLPVGEAAWYSGFNWNGFGRPTNWIGLDNYRFVFDNRAFGTAFKNNLLIIVVSLVIQLPLALSLAIILADRFRGAVALRMVFFLPYILAEIATGLIFSFVYDGDYGLLAAIYKGFGAEAPHLLASPQTAFAAILIVVVWKYFGFHMMLFIAALQTIDRSMLEAARIDGASRWQSLRYVVIPSLAPTIRLSVFFAIVGSLQLFDLVMPLTRGGPSDSSHTMVSFLYTFGITRMRVGFGSAVGVILFLICVVFAFTYKRWIMRDE
ncbi:Carbohydrate ABC transporter membrane protein 1, CUT1 family [Bosea sp. 62]|uniref:carbohydrate ABC transporter permease n=1 Tax=unclassified Bosea (in: a-proteobacteria) TaxID=2653178 RepID=UPI001255A54C|nr:MULTISPECIES: sugar ABC transporter permease [unclassified Bosea (in: a-proteobacteria)]CAD5251488.1 Carbohydrate ABC transporter membrane protein 1, CUT1 family [Bosea sp. 7B]CAD5280491.1 Carbohydrate ABC transporter membrane protein 1, CUT1 family [Bosea sp. 21B]CAD5281599.1 Carbohydrate ABC transporter membrane protein 1, CUT1 family [Bosea sp. 46]VVT59425.1 Carbohydrate ABC transporter membrane protein 1, CUT1 family [Bosea sp. EC-HK365B]VXB28550.1 Carbohydrate ABC transporter membrane 